MVWQKNAIFGKNFFSLSWQHKMQEMKVLIRVGCKFIKQKKLSVFVKCFYIDYFNIRRYLLGNCSFLQKLERRMTATTARTKPQSALRTNFIVVIRLTVSFSSPDDENSHKITRAQHGFKWCQKAKSFNSFMILVLHTHRLTISLLTCDSICLCFVFSVKYIE